jgi:Ni,Fe-hydrogenase III component G
MNTPWGPGILLSYIISNDEKDITNKHYSYYIIVSIEPSKPSYMIIKKAFYGATMVSILSRH